MDLAALTVPEVVAVLGLGGTILAVYKGVIDSRKSPAPAAAQITTPKNEVAIDIDKRYVEAMEEMAEAFKAVAAANTRLGTVNERQAMAMEAIGKAIDGWIHKYERDKDEDRLDQLETQLARIYNMVAPPESRPRRTNRPGDS